MFEKLEITRMAQALAAHAGTRMGVIARNVAHADTPGFIAKDTLDFALVYETQDEPMRGTRPGHIADGGSSFDDRTVASGGSASPNGNTVSLELEMVKMAEARQDHEMALAVYRATSDVIRASLGRSR